MIPRRMGLYDAILLNPARHPIEFVPGFNAHHPNFTFEAAIRSPAARIMPGEPQGTHEQFSRREGDVRVAVEPFTAQVLRQALNRLQGMFTEKLHLPVHSRARPSTPVTYTILCLRGLAKATMSRK